MAWDSQPTPRSLLPQEQSFRAGATLSWDGQSWQVANIGSTKMSLLAEDGNIVEVAQTTVESLVKEGRISQVPAVRERDSEKLSNELLRASEE